MADPKEFKQKIRDILAQEFRIEFLGEDFDRIVSMLTKPKEEKIYNWILGVIKKSVQPITIGSKKEYRQWKMNQLLVFRHPFNIANTEYRVLFVKVKNAYYIEFHLGDHKYYDKVRKDMDLKKTSY